ncbi:hypothetical protein BD309DRAFT_961526 [Dichomitus squalens]|nr:hypothetical protein BD309DRAFT_961526 [Dichomitus squalens]
MHLLDTYTGQFVEKDPKDEDTVYAILSHTWNHDPPEQTYDQLKKIQERYAPVSAGPQIGTEVLQPPLSSSPRGLPDGVTCLSPVQDSSPIPTPSARTLHVLLPSVAADGASNPTNSTTADSYGQANPPAVSTGTCRPGHTLRRIWRFVLLNFACRSDIDVDPTPAHPPEVASTSESPSTTSESSTPSPDPYPPLPSHDPSLPSLSRIWEDPELSPKIRDACAVARKAGYQYIWIDSCCIDKSSSSELSEAINSMYHWYGYAAMCYAFLADVPPDDDPREIGSRFRQSRWYTRGWTLQELIAPLQVMFLSNEWTVIGSKTVLADLVEEITGISGEALLHVKSLDEFSLAQRLSWAAKRETTRREDRAYSLLGLVNINMPTLYGEGALAFRRLQEQIVQRVPDQSLFAWEHVYTSLNPGDDLLTVLRDDLRITGWPHNTWTKDEDEHFPTLFADDVESFTHAGKIRALSHRAVLRRLEPFRIPRADYTFTPHGIRTQLPLIPISLCLPSIKDDYRRRLNCHYLAILRCEHVDYPDHLLGRFCYVPASNADMDVVYSGRTRFALANYPQPDKVLGFYGLFPVSPATIKRCHKAILLETVYLSHPERSFPYPQGSLRLPHTMISLILLKATRDALLAKGYTAELRGPNQSHPTAHWLTLSNDRHAITIQFQHTLQHGGGSLGIRVDAKVPEQLLDPLGGAEDIQAVVNAYPQASPVYFMDQTPWKTSLAPFSQEQILYWSSPPPTPIESSEGRKSPFPWSYIRDMQVRYSNRRPVRLSFLAPEYPILELGMNYGGGGYYILQVDIFSETTEREELEFSMDDVDWETRASHVESESEDEGGREVLQRAVDNGSTSESVLTRWMEEVKGVFRLDGLP